jgi:hypothetical protein
VSKVQLKRMAPKPSGAARTKKPAKPTEIDEDGQGRLL